MAAGALALLSMPELCEATGIPDEKLRPRVLAGVEAKEVRRALGFDDLRSDRYVYGDVVAWLTSDPAAEDAPAPRGRPSSRRVKL